LISKAMVVSSSRKEIVLPEHRRSAVVHAQ
jgi:hypothetical protein